MAIIKLSYALFLAVVEKFRYIYIFRYSCVGHIFCAVLVFGILKVFTTDFILALRASSQIVITNND